MLHNTCGKIYLNLAKAEHRSYGEPKALLSVAKEGGYNDGATVEYGKVLHPLGERELAYEVLYRCVEADIDSAVNQYNGV